MSLRVIGGKFKRLLLATLPGDDITRPTSDRARESLFNILGNLENTIFVDLFSGSGAVGIEALSRGAKFAFFIENNSKASKLIEHNLNHLKIPNSFFKILQTNVNDFISLSHLSYLSYLPHEISQSHQNLNLLIFADPPYNSTWYTDCVSKLATSSFVNSRTEFIVEKSAASPKIMEVPSWECFDERKYGKATLEFWRPKETTE